MAELDRGLRGHAPDNTQVRRSIVKSRISRQVPGAAGPDIESVMKSVPFSSASGFLKWSFENPSSVRAREFLRKYYTSYFDNTEQIDYVWRFIDRRSRTLTESARRKARILEVGCGVGTNSLWAGANGGSIVGIEVKRRDVAVAEERRKHLEEVLGRKVDVSFVWDNALEFVDEGGFDVVFLQEAFHHIEPRTEAVPKLASLLRPGGMIVMQETNAWNALIQARLFRHRGFRTVGEKLDPDTGRSYAYGRERILTAGGLDRLFAPLGFTSRTEYFRLLPVALARIERLAEMAERVERRLDQSPFLVPFYVFYEWVGVVGRGPVTTRIRRPALDSNPGTS